jgi:hypothetical protein
MKKSYLKIKNVYILYIIDFKLGLLDEINFLYFVFKFSNSSIYLYFFYSV